MNRPLKIASMLIVVVIVLIMGLLWQRGIRAPEKLFKTTINEINNELSKKSSKKDVSYFISRLRYIAGNYPESIWADDAQRILADLYRGFDSEKAINEYQKIIKKFPNSKIEEWTLKNCTFATFLKYINEIPATVEAQSQIADTYFQGLKNYQKTIEEAQKIIDTYPDVTPSDKPIFRLVIFRYDQIARSYEKLGEIEKAIKTYQGVLDRFPDADVTKIIRTKIEELKPQS